MKVKLSLFVWISTTFKQSFYKMGFVLRIRNVFNNIQQTSVWANSPFQKFNLVCDNTYLHSLSVSAYFFGYVLATVTLCPLGDVIGRRKMVVIASTVEFLANIIMPFSYNVYMFIVLRFLDGAAALVYNQGAFISDYLPHNWIMVALSMVGKFGISGVYGEVFIYTGELFPTVVRSFVIAVCSFGGRIGSNSSPYMFRLADGKMKRALPLLIYGVVTIFVAFLSILLPETKKRKLLDRVCLFYIKPYCLSTFSDSDLPKTSEGSEDSDCERGILYVTPDPERPNLDLEEIAIECEAEDMRMMNFLDGAQPVCQHVEPSCTLGEMPRLKRRSGSICQRKKYHSKRHRSQSVSDNCDSIFSESTAEPHVDHDYLSQAAQPSDHDYSALSAQPPDQDYSSQTLDHCCSTGQITTDIILSTETVPVENVTADFLVSESLSVSAEESENPLIKLQENLASLVCSPYTLTYNQQQHAIEIVEFYQREGATPSVKLGRVGKFDKKVILHKLPKEQYIRRAWIRAISRKNWKPTSYTRVCSDHFRDGIGPNSVDRNKIPTENLPQRGIITHQNKRQPRTRLENVDSPIDALQHHS
uniref:Solute carrier family 22 member 5 n=1 Tax=Magallana gigas TaxID=29159 RepID=K1Q036_MAGGI